MTVLENATGGGQNMVDPGKSELTVGQDELPRREGAAQPQLPRKDFPLSSSQLISADRLALLFLYHGRMCLAPRLTWCRCSHTYQLTHNPSGAQTQAFRSQLKYHLLGEISADHTC
ncbi:uncharacterized protein LOC124903319 [Homo sapiens]|uniref:uncharacterized protein LOC124903319 n=1 Tax=Homo sapiens TaxID=9606 RepID=UPI001FB0DE74|nr:uncharacterized protein LOC124903319 [Homo sapiens]XP_047302315.1 uncharacterized protein LOC124903319 [Homo sapiens]